MGGHPITNTLRAGLNAVDRGRAPMPPWFQNEERGSRASPIPSSSPSADPHSARQDSYPMGFANRHHPHLGGRPKSTRSYQNRRGKGHRHRLLQSPSHQAHKAVHRSRRVKHCVAIVIHCWDAIAVNIVELGRRHARRTQGDRWARRRAHRRGADHRCTGPSHSQAA